MLKPEGVKILTWTLQEMQHVLFLIFCIQGAVTFRLKVSIGIWNAVVNI
jgi:hypothetical protein